jgi:hypothetical protein
MPDVKEVFEMVTKQKPPDPGALERQFRAQRRRMARRKAGVYGLVAAFAIGAAIVAVGVGGGVDPTKRGPLDQPSSPTTAPGAAAPVATVTSDGSTCSMEITADRIEPGAVVFEVVNASDKRVMFDSWQLLDGYTFQAFETAVERVGRLAEAGKPYPTSGSFPDQETEVRYLQSDVIPANSSEIIVTTMSSGPHAIACLKRFEGAHRSLRGFQAFGLVGPIDVL